MAETVYLLCAATSSGCAVLLLRGYRKSFAKLLLWSGLCFVGLALSNIVLFVDLILIPNVDFAVFRTTVSLLAMSILVFGLVWESR